MADGGTTNSLAFKFDAGKTPNAGDIHVLVQTDTSKVRDAVMKFDPETAVFYKNLLSGKELDTGKLEKAGIKGIDRTDTYYDFKTFSAAVTQDFNRSMSTAVDITNKLTVELGYGKDRTWAAPTPLKDVATQGNDVQSWELTRRVLQGVRDQAEREKTPGTEKLVAQADVALKNLERSGALAAETAVVFFDYSKPKAPGMEYPAMNFDQCRVTAPAVAGTCLKTEPVKP